LNAAGLVGGKVAGQLTEPVAAIRSTRAAMKREQERPVREKARERSHAALLIRQRESRRPRER